MLIVLEGLDGAGKSTQVELVRRMFAQEGVESHFLHFPRFDAPVYGELIARFLRVNSGLWTRSILIWSLCFRR